MKKLLLGLAIAVLGLSGTNTSVGATDSCTISDTGPNSSNSCVVKEDFECEVKNENDFEVVNKNTQEATSGKATVEDNTDGGDATSGSATNSNGTVIDVSIDNSGACVVTAVRPPAPVVPGGGAGDDDDDDNGNGAARPVGGLGAVRPVVAPGQGAAPAVLPETSAESTIGLVAGLITALGMTIVGSRAAVSAFSKMQ